jgi:hypothetical protein
MLDASPYKHAHPCCVSVLQSLCVQVLRPRGVVREGVVVVEPAQAPVQQRVAVTFPYLYLERPIQMPHRGPLGLGRVGKVAREGRGLGVGLMGVVVGQEGLGMGAMGVLEAMGAL